MRVGDFPTVKQVAAVYPDLVGAKRWFIPWEPIPVAASDRTCFGDWAVPLAAETGRLAVFDDSQGRQYEPGFPSPTMAVYGFASTAGAKSAFADLTRLFDRCAGNREKDGTAVAQKQLDLPSGLIGYRRVTTTPDGDVTIRAALVVGCDGRHSTVREKAGLSVEELGAPMDVLWFGLSRRSDDAVETGGAFLPGRVFVMLNRGAIGIQSEQCERPRARRAEGFDGR